MSSTSAVTFSEVLSSLEIEIRTLSPFPSLLIFLLLTFVPPIVSPLLYYILTYRSSSSLLASQSLLSAASLRLSQLRSSPTADFVSLSLSERNVIALTKSHELVVSSSAASSSSASKKCKYFEIMYYSLLLLRYYGVHLATLSSPLDDQSTGSRRKGQYLRSLVFPCHSFLASLGGFGAPGIDSFRLPEYEGWRGGGIGAVAVIWAGRKVGQRFVELAGRTFTTSTTNTNKTRGKDNGKERELKGKDKGRGKKTD